MLDKLNLRILLVIFSVMFFISCNPNRVYHEKYTFEDYQWQKDEKIIFKPYFNAEETKKDHLIQFNIRHIQGFPYQYLNLTILVTRPDGTQAEKEESIQIREANGDYIGDGAGSYWDLDYTLKEAFKFDQTGEYIIEISPITEKDPVYFMNELGLSILKNIE